MLQLLLVGFGFAESERQVHYSKMEASGWLLERVLLGIKPGNKESELLQE